MKRQILIMILVGIAVIIGSPARGESPAVLLEKGIFAEETKGDLDSPGEQIVTADPDGTIRIYACPSAGDAPGARHRYDHPYYSASLRLWAVGSNRTNLGGL